MARAGKYTAQDVLERALHGSLDALQVALVDGSGAQLATIPLTTNTVNDLDSVSNASSNKLANAAGNTIYVRTMPLLYNGAGWDRQRSKVPVTLLASAARTTTQTSADISTYNCVGVRVVLDMTTVGTASVTVSINGKDQVSGKYFLLLAGAAVTTNSTNVYTVYPGAPVTANVSTSLPISAIIQVVVTANNANSGTYSVGYELLS